MYATTRNLRLSTLAAICVLLAACGSSSSSSNVSDGGSGGDRGTAEIKTSFDQILTAADGEDVAFTVYVPENPRGESAPLLIHSHGFGLSRAKNLESPNPIDAFITNDTSAEVARQAWLEEGYYVISFDQRGFGDSSGKIGLMNPDIDCRNVSQIIDWAEQNLPNLASENNDPRIGAIGLSYGGGFQTVCASVDKRFDALVPLATWSHLPY
ncbi:MAG: alpha/beta hydrolase, partial [Spongiibacteraceae bacterium]